ncbi:MAG: hypothetical protein VYE22_27160 [Myxococcota bacterium]|nr:hypothetical protein [Myxococcota bacterium]
MLRHGLLLWLLALSGCSNFAGPHHPYAPLLDRGGQVDVAAGVGLVHSAGVTFTGRAAVAPVDGFVITAAAHLDPIDLGDGTRQYAGELGLGAFAMGDDALRAELLAGVGGGYAYGRWNGEDGDEGLEGPYARPFLQGTLAGRWGVVTWGGGLRLGVTVADLTVTPIDPGGDLATPGLGAQVSLDPFTTVRLDFGALHVDLTGGGAVAFGERTVGQMGNVHVALTVGARFSAWGEAPSDQSATTRQ